MLTTNSVTSMLMRFNLQWYQQEMKALLTRYKIFILFILTLAAPTASSCFDLFAFPLKNYFGFQFVSFISLSISIFAFQAFSLLWTMLHQLVMLKHPWQSYFQTLAITPFQQAAADCVLLLLIDLILLISMACSILAACLSSHLSGLHLLLLLSKFLFITISILCIQIVYIRQNPFYYVFVLLLNLGIIFTICSQLTYLQIPMFLGSIVVLTLVIVNVKHKKLFTLRFNFNSKKKSTAYTIEARRDFYLPYFPLLRIQVKNLLTTLPQYSVMLLSLGVINIFAISFMVFGQLNESFFFILSIIMLSNALALSNLFPRLDRDWQRYDNFITTLPLTPSTLFKVNFFTAMILLFLLSIIPILLTMPLSMTLDYKPWCAMSIAVLFLAVSYFPQTQLKQYGFLVACSFWFAFSYFNFLIM